MNKAEASERIDKLKTLINDYRYHYHVLDESIMSEGAADSLKHELSKLEELYPDLLTSDSPSQRVAGVALDKFDKISHIYPMLSLQDVFDQEEVESWITRINKLVPGQDNTYFCDIKMDGFACALVYQDGILEKAITRGDGRVGEDVTMNVRTIDNVPINLRRIKGYEQFLNGRTEIRGEVVMLKSDFEMINKQRESAGLPTFANPRNLAAGTIRQLDSKLVAERPLRFRAYDIYAQQPDQVPTFEAAYDIIRNLGIATNKEASTLKDIDSLMNFANIWDTKRHDLPFNTDGLVIKVNERKAYEKLGVVGKTPRGAVAFKYAAEQATTIVKEIIISIGRTGAATPVAVFDPVLVAGSTVRHASLHNADEIKRKDIRVGDTVIIFKAGDIIPQVESVVMALRPKDAKTFLMEKELYHQYPELEFVRPEGEAVYRVKGVTGPLLLKKSLEHFASKGALDIDGLGEKNVVALVDSGLVEDIADIYMITVDQLLKLDRFAKISATKLVSAIDAKKSPSLSRFIFALGIRHVGAQTAIDLANNFKNLDNLGLASYEQLKDIDGVGEVVADSILGWFLDDDNQDLLAKFRRLNIWPEEAKVTSGKLTGKSFVITGTLESMSRDLAAEEIRALGGTFQSSVAKGTTYLVVGANAGSSKAEKAQKLGTEVIDEQQLLKILA